jgi:hypothetical protein
MRLVVVGGSDPGNPRGRRLPPTRHDGAQAGPHRRRDRPRRPPPLRRLARHPERQGLRPIARTGLRDHETIPTGLQALTVATEATDHTPYYPDAHTIQLRLTADTATGRLLGYELLGHRDAQIAKRIDTPAAALHAGWPIERLNDLDLSYTPPFGTPWDALQVAAQARQTAANDPSRQTAGATPL